MKRFLKRLVLCIVGGLLPISPILSHLWAVPVKADERQRSDHTATQCAIKHIVPERLPDMTIPRSGHSILYAGGELTIFGGHTTNFVPSSTAEYFSEGSWHQLPMAYSHDNGFALLLRDGEVIIGGGHNEELGIGQTFTMERYTPQTHAFMGFGCLDQRRALTNAIQLGNGQVIISGNHYASDAIACYDGSSQVQHVKDVCQGRSNPYILPIAVDNAVIVGANDLKDCCPDTMWADCVKGAPFRVPLLEKWHLVYTDQPFTSSICSIGDEEKGDYAYLLTATDGNGQLGIVEMRDTSFLLLPTVCPIPMKTPFGQVYYKGPVVVDKERQRGYVIGVDSLYRRQFVLAIDYAQQPADLTLYYTDPLERSAVTIPILTPDGDLILAGGISNDNYHPHAAVWCYHLATPQMAALHGDGPTIPIWLWVLVAAFALAALWLIIHYIIRCRKGQAEDIDGGSTQTDGQSSQHPIPTEEELLQRICELLEERQLYLGSRLKATDVAMELGVSVSRITDCLTSQRGITFTQLLGEYRVRHAQQLLSAQPDIKLMAVISESGFTSESTFFRTFKAVTGFSPKEWLAANTNEPLSSPD